jgi:hypothetical protein
LGALRLAAHSRHAQITGADTAVLKKDSANRLYPFRNPSVAQTRRDTVAALQTLSEPRNPRPL